MSESKPPPYPYQPGQVVNGYVFTGTQWLPVQNPAPSSPWRTLGGVVALVVAVIAGLVGMSWMMSWLELESEGNQFSGILMILGMGALAVAAGFGIAGIILLTKKR